MAKMDIKYQRGEVRPPARLSHKLSAYSLMLDIKAVSKEIGFPVDVREDVISSGMFKTYECVVISHPSPPAQYFSQVIVFNGDILNFYFYGHSDATYKNNVHAQRKKGGFISMLVANMTSDFSMERDTEMAWHYDVQRLIIERIFETC